MGLRVFSLCLVGKNALLDEPRDFAKEVCELIIFKHLFSFGNMVDTII